MGHNHTVIKLKSIEMFKDVLLQSVCIHFMIFNQMLNCFLIQMKDSLLFDEICCDQPFQYIFFVVYRHIICII